MGYETKGGGITPARALIGALGLLCSLLVMVSAPAPGFADSSAGMSATDPMGSTKALVDQVLAILRHSKANLAEERQQLRSLAEAHLDFDSMARSTLGYHWRDLSADQRAQFTTLFTSFIEDAYLSRFQDYSGQEVQFLRETLDSPDYAEVYTQVASKGKEPIQLNFMLRHTSGDWRIYDINVDGISITGNYRTQFNRVINNNGFPALMADLHVKQQGLANSLGKKP